MKSKHKKRVKLYEKRNASEERYRINYRIASIPVSHDTIYPEYKRAAQ